MLRMVGAPLLELVIPSAARNLVLRKRRAQQIPRYARNDKSSTRVIERRAQDFLSFLCCNPQRFHLAIEVASFQAQHLGSAADIAMILIELFQDVVALVSVPGLVQS